MVSSQAEFLNTRKGLVDLGSEPGPPTLFVLAQNRFVLRFYFRQCREAFGEVGTL